MSSRMYLDKEIQRMLANPVNRVLAMTENKMYDELVAQLKKYGKQDARVQYWVICIAEEKAIRKNIFADGEDTDIIMRDAQDRVDRFGKKAFPLRDWQVEKVARSFVGWSA